MAHSLSDLNRQITYRFGEFPVIYMNFCGFTETDLAELLHRVQESRKKFHNFSKFLETLQRSKHTVEKAVKELVAL